MLAVLIVGGCCTLFVQKPVPARRITCITNVKEVCLAAAMYAEDYDARLPNATRWIDLTLPYLKDEAAYRCPEVKRHPTDDYGYAFNWSLSLKPLQSLKAPGRTPLIYDTDLLYRNACAPGLIGLSRPPRHPNGNTIGFLDGHVRSMPLDRSP